MTRLHAAQLLMVAPLLIAGGCSRRESSPVPVGRPAPEPAGMVECDGFQIHYETFGEGRPIVLVHGWGSSLDDNWVKTGWVEALAATRRVVALDVRGHGASDKPHDQAVYSYVAMSRDVLAVMDHLQIEKADYLGYSMGAFMGVHLLGHVPHRFTSMILGGIGDESADSLAVLPKIVEGLRAADASQVTDPVGIGFRAFAERDPRNDLEALAVAALEMWPEGFPLELAGPGAAQVDIPVLIVNGSNDHPYVDTAQKLVDAIPRARLAVIPDRDHLGTVTDPRFKERVLDFLAY